MAVQPDAAQADQDADNQNAADSFWAGGAKGRLLIAHCATCQRLVHPPRGTCVQCGQTLVSTPVSGTGVIFSYTINYQQYQPDVAVPYVIALVELAEQPGLRIAANIVDCEPDSVHIGMSVQVRFEQRDARYVPVFAPSTGEQSPGAGSAG